MKRKSFLLMLLILPIIAVNAQLYYVSGTFKVIETSTYTQYPGVQGSPINTNSTIKIVFKRSTSFVADSFWHNGFVSNILIRNTKGESFSGSAKKGDTLILFMNYFQPTENPNFPPEMQNNNGSKKEKTRVKHSGQLLFRYGFEKPQYFFSVKTLKKAENIYAP